MSARNVWNCISIYRNSSAKQIEKKFGTIKAIYAALNLYGGLNAYHGHASGGYGDKTNPSADKNLDLAIAFLKKFVVKAPDTTIRASSSSSSSKGKYVDKNAEMLKLIEEYSHLGKLQMELSKKDTNWRLNKKVNKAYENKKARIRIERKNK